MPITGTCQTCGTKAPLEHFLIEEKYKRSIVAALAIDNSIAGLVISYLGMFSPASGRAVRADKLARMVDELSTLVNSGQVTRNRVTHVAPLALWKLGLEETLAVRDAGKLVTPLENHHFLEAVVWSMAAKGKGKREMADASRPLHPSHKVVQPDEVRRRGLGSAGLVSALQMLQQRAPNDEIRKQLADAEAKLTGSGSGKET